VAGVIDGRFQRGAPLWREPGPESPLRRLRKRLRRFSLGRIALFVAVLLLGGCAGNLHMSFLNPQGPVARAEMVHFYIVLGIMAVLVAAPIFVLTPLIMWRYRYGTKSSARYAPKWTDNKALGIAIWAGPTVIVGILSFFVWRDAHRLDPYKPLASNQPALRIDVIGYDWKWLFIYPDQGIASIGELALPVGRPVAMHLTSATVMQSLFIPALGSQIYEMGGMDTQLNLEAGKPGRFLGENTMYNGNGFHHQKFTAVGMSTHDFNIWAQTVRAHGIPMNQRVLDAISQRDTRDALVATLPQAKTMGGNLYLTDVSAALFPAVIQATMNGTQVDLAREAPPSAATLPAAGAGRPAHSMMERRQ